ncbi:MAG: cupredoxin family copper-binding protein [Acidimicrobiia bacterium]|nr:cupredoxin family copper-binding protein [Acidimicrobiia bacterium]
MLVLALASGCGSNGDGDGRDTAASDTAATGSTTTTATETTTTVSRAEGVLDLEIVDYAYQPTVDEISVGETITWTNRDEFEHTTTADDGTWDSGPLAEGGSFEVTFDEPGTYAYHCDIHNFMTGEIVVR